MAPQAANALVQAMAELGMPRGAELREAPDLPGGLTRPPLLLMAINCF